MSDVQPHQLYYSMRKMGLQYVKKNPGAQKQNDVSSLLFPFTRFSSSLTSCNGQSATYRLSEATAPEVSLSYIQTKLTCRRTTWAPTHGFTPSTVTPLRQNVIIAHSKAIVPGVPPVMASGTSSSELGRKKARSRSFPLTAAFVSFPSLSLTDDACSTSRSRSALQFQAQTEVHLRSRSRILDVWKDKGKG